MTGEGRFSASLDGLLPAFSRLTAQDLDRQWVWRDYTDDGLRFALLRTYEELVELRTHLRAERASSDQPLSKAERLLGEYHRAFRGLEAMLYGLSNEQADLEPEPGEWSVRRTLGHVLTAELGFLPVVKLALEAESRGDAPTKPTEQDWDRFVGLSDEEYDALMAAPITEMWSAYAEWHERVLEELQVISDSQLQAPSRYWEEDAYTVEFRLLRFSSHRFQHSVQIEKSLRSSVGPPTEASRLVRELARVRADIESVRIGSPTVGKQRVDELAETLQERWELVAGVLHAD